MSHLAESTCHTPAFNRRNPMVLYSNCYQSNAKCTRSQLNQLKRCSLMRSHRFVSFRFFSFFPVCLTDEPPPFDLLLSFFFILFRRKCGGCVSPACHSSKALPPLFGRLVLATFPHPCSDESNSMHFSTVSTALLSAPCCCLCCALQFSSRCLPVQPPPPSKRLTA